MKQGTIAQIGSYSLEMTARVAPPDQKFLI
jgi:hypothetical protein